MQLGNLPWLAHIRECWLASYIDVACTASLDSDFHFLSSHGLCGLYCVAKADLEGVELSEILTLIGLKNGIVKHSQLLLIKIILGMLYSVFKYSDTYTIQLKCLVQT